MRSWKTPALLATVGLCGLGSLFAQSPPLPSLSDPTPFNSPAQQMQDLPAPISYDQNPVAPAPVYESAVPRTVEQSFSSGAPVYSETPIYQDAVNMQSAPAAGCDGCATAAPAPASDGCGSDCTVSGDSTVECALPAPQMYGSPMISQPSCGCQGSGSSSWGAFDGSVNYGYGMGSGSGVSSGILSPNANSGGLHTRYPYYNYRHPWHYQGPPSQNVTIVW